MGQTRDFRVQTSTPTSPSTSDKYTYYINSSGILHVVTSAGSTYQANQLNTNNIAMLGQNITTGIAKFNNGTANIYSGIAVGSTGTQPYTSFLGLPQMWIPIVGPSGESLCLAAYLRS